MSDVDTLIVMFQTQLSDVMDTLVKTAMHELTRLVEDGFVEEMRRRAQDAESLRAQLQWAERKLSDGGGPAIGTTARCTDCGKALCRADGTTGEADDDDEEEEENSASSAADLLQYGVLIGCDLKQEDDAMELCTESNGQEVTSELAQEADVPVLIPSPVRESATTEQDDARPVVDVKKEEEVNESSCSAENAGDWPVGHDGGGSDSHGMSEWADASRPDRTRQSSSEEELLMRTVIRQEEEEEDKDPRGPPAAVTHAEHPRLDRTGSGGCETAIAAAVVMPKRTPPVAGRVGRDHIVSSPPRARQQRFPAGVADVGTVVIKEEIIVNSEEEEGEEEEMTTITRSGAPSPAFTVNHQYAALPGDVLHKQGNVSRNKLMANKEAALKPYPSKVGGSSSATTPKAAAAAAALQPLGKKLAAHSPMMRGISVPSSAGAAHSQAFNLNRTPTTTLSSRSGGGTRSGGVGPPPLLSFHRAHHHQNDPNNNNNNKRALLSLTRASSIPWVSIKTHHSQQQSSTHSSSSQNLLLHHHGTTTTTSTAHSGSSSLSAPPPSSSSQHALLRCGQCGKCFPHPSNLKAHAQTHTGERPFCCSLCGRSFTKLSNLKAHRRVHTGERPYCCLACGKRFTQKCNLKRHQRIHVDA